jgi:hypothetical protein
MVFSSSCGVVAAPVSLIGIGIVGCVTPLAAPQFCSNPPVTSGSFTTLSALIQDPGLEFTSGGGAGIQADFDGNSLTLTVLGGFFDLYFVFSSADWALQNVTQPAGSNLGVTAFQFDQHSIVISTRNTEGENYPHSATFLIDAVRLSP